MGSQQIDNYFNQLDAQSSKYAPGASAPPAMAVSRSQIQQNVSPSDVDNYFNSLDSQAASQKQQQVTPPPAGSPMMNFIQGAGAGWGNQYGNIANLIPGVNVPQIQRPSGLASAAGNVLGTVGGFMSGGDIADTLRLGAEAIPYIGQAAQYLGSQGLGGAIGSVAKWTGLGAAESPTNRPLGAAIGATAALTPFGVAGVSSLTGMNAGNIAEDLYNTAANGIPKSELNAENMGHIINNYQANKEATTDLYTKVGQDAQSAGYATSGSPRTYTGAGGFTINPGKYIAPDTDTENNLNSVLSNIPSDTSLKNVSQTLQGRISQYLTSPTYNNAHLLQSGLGEAASTLKAGNATQADLATANNLNQIRASIRNNIVSTFKNNGDQNLADAYTNASNVYRQTVVPYMKVGPVWNSIQGKKFPPNVLNVLSSDDQPGYYDQIRSDIAKNPQQSNNILAQAMGKYANQNADGSYSVPKPKVMANGINNLPTYLSQFSESAGVNPHINALNTAIGRRQIAIHAAQIAGGSVALSAAAHYIPGIKELIP